MDVQPTFHHSEWPDFMMMDAIRTIAKGTTATRNPPANADDTKTKR